MTLDNISNGIRFSISDLSPPSARIIPTVWVDRSSISLYDSQFDPETGEQIPIPGRVIKSISQALRRFMVVCRDFGVPDDRIHMVATEATRVAINSKQLLDAIHAATGHSVEVLSKEDEGEIGALGIASGFSSMKGLVMDLGGGSTQLTWIISKTGRIRTSARGPSSFPYGAAALTKMLQDIQNGKDKKDAEHAVEELRKDMVQEFREAYENLGVPNGLREEAKQEGGFRIYLSGGGFRGWGYLLLYLKQSHGKHYPISIINGFTVGSAEFEDTETLKRVAKAADDIFRISDRRRLQVPAVAFLVNVLAEAIPLGIKEAHFCQGGVREGYIFKDLAPSIRQQSPLDVATIIYAPPAKQQLKQLLKSAIPETQGTGKFRFPSDFGDHVLDGFVNGMYVHMFMSKETASMAALYSTSAGIMSSTHGISHQDRARLALMLQARYRGELPPREIEVRDSLQDIITPEEGWWAQYLGRVGYLITGLYPTGEVNPSTPSLVFSAEWSRSLGKKKQKAGIVFTVCVNKVNHKNSWFKALIKDNLKHVRKAGKKKNWIGHRKERWGMKVEASIVEESIY